MTKLLDKSELDAIRERVKEVEYTSEVHRECQEEATRRVAKNAKIFLETHAYQDIPALLALVDAQQEIVKWAAGRVCESPHREMGPNPQGYAAVVIVSDCGTCPTCQARTLMERMKG